MAKQALPKHALDYRANQLNPMHPQYYRDRGANPVSAEKAAAQQRDKLNKK